MPIDWEQEIKPRAKKDLAIIVDQERVDQVLGKLLATYRTDGFPYHLDASRVPQDERHMPPELERGSVEHAMFFWNVCYWMRGGTESSTAVRQMSLIYRDRPDLFDCRKIIETTPEDIAEVIGSHGLGMQRSNGRFWHKNAQRLLDTCDGDPRLLFEGIENGQAGFEVLLDRIANQGKKGFYGFQKKMTSMIAYYYMAEGLVEKKTLPLPVDLHVARVSIATEMVKFPETPIGTNLLGDDQLLDLLRDVYLRYAEDNDVDWLELCDAVWLLSQTLCGDAPGNQMEEPHGLKRRKGRSTPLRSIPVNIHDPRQQRAYEATCRDCPVNQECAYNVPAGRLYYVLGMLGILKAREQFPEPKPIQPPYTQTLELISFE